jgi:hypothetical protein
MGINIGVVDGEGESDGDGDGDGKVAPDGNGTSIGLHTTIGLPG